MLLEDCLENLIKTIQDSLQKMKYIIIIKSKKGWPIIDRNIQDYGNELYTNSRRY